MSVSWAVGSIREAYRHCSQPHWRTPYYLGHIISFFLWIFLGGPYIKRLRGVAWLTSALSAITAAVVGVVVNLAVWFGLMSLFTSQQGLDWLALALFLVALIGMLRWKWDVIPVVLGAGLAGLIYRSLI